MVSVPWKIQHKKSLCAQAKCVLPITKQTLVVRFGGIIKARETGGWVVEYEDGDSEVLKR